jgi:hypothetical protein
MKQTLFFMSMFVTTAIFANAESYKVKLVDPVVVDGKELKAGDYKVDVNDTTAVIRNGKDSTEVKVKMESTDRKYDATTVRCTKENGKNNLQEIRVGGTKTKLVFDTAKTANGGM